MESLQDSSHCSSTYTSWSPSQMCFHWFSVGHKLFWFKTRYCPTLHKWGMCGTSTIYLRTSFGQPTPRLRWRRLVRGLISCESTGEFAWKQDCWSLIRQLSSPSSPTGCWVIHRNMWCKPQRKSLAADRHHWKTPHTTWKEPEESSHLILLSHLVNAAMHFNLELTLSVY